MIRHIVFLQVKPEVSLEKLGAVLNKLAALKSDIPSMLNFSYGANCSPEQLNKNFTHVFTMDFEHIEGRDDYLNHPEHTRVALELVMPLLVNGLESAMVIDYVC